MNSPKSIVMRDVGVSLPTPTLLCRDAYSVGAAGVIALPSLRKKGLIMLSCHCICIIMTVFLPIALECSMECNSLLLSQPLTSALEHSAKSHEQWYSLYLPYAILFCLFYGVTVVKINKVLQSSILLLVLSLLQTFLRLIGSSKSQESLLQNLTNYLAIFCFRNYCLFRSKKRV